MAGPPARICVDIPYCLFDLGLEDVKEGRRTRPGGEVAGRDGRSSGNHPDLPFRQEKDSTEIIDRGIGGPEILLESVLGKRGSLRRKRRLQVVDHEVHDDMVREESDNFHPAAAPRTEQRVGLADLPDHLRPALGRDGQKLLLYNSERKGITVRLLEFPPMSVGAEAVISDSDLTLVRDVRGHRDDEKLRPKCAQKYRKISQSGR